MNEAYLKKRLVEAVRKAMPGCVVVRHEDKFTAGIPDVSVTWRGVTSWTEVKFSRHGRRSVPTALQCQALERLHAAGAPAYLLEYREGSTFRVTELNRVVVSGGPMTTRSEVLEGFDHKGVAECLRQEHLSRQTESQMVAEFMAKFGVPQAGSPTMSVEAARRRYDHLSEEMGEMFRAINQKDLVEVTDAAVDLTYVAIGLGIELGVPWREVFSEVHRANMAKVREDGGGGGGHKLGIKKPEGWKGPDVRGILERAKEAR